MTPSDDDPAAAGSVPLDGHSDRASIARVYDAALGGTDNYEIDRQVTAENTHQIARRIDATARVVYVDNDPAIIARGTALLADDPYCRVVSADRASELELCDLWWPDGPKLRPLNQVERCIACAIGRKP